MGKKKNSLIEKQEEVIEKVTTIKKYDSKGKPKEERVEKVTKRKITTFQNSGKKHDSSLDLDMNSREICPALDFSRSDSSQLSDSASRLTKIKEDSREQDPETERNNFPSGCKDDTILKIEDEVDYKLRSLEKGSTKTKENETARFKEAVRSKSPLVRGSRTEEVSQA